MPGYRGFFVAGLGAAAAALGSGAAWSQAVSMLTPVDELRRGRVARPLVFQGLEVDPQSWKAVLFLERARMNCTATLVGPNVVLTAAHCVKKDEPVIVRFRTIVVKGKCEPYSKYDLKVNKSPDYGLCLLDDRLSDLPSKGYRKPERISFEPHDQDDELSIVMIAGLGCSTIAAQKEPPTLRLGLARVMRLPREDAKLPEHLFTSPDLQPGTNAVICPQDSGGPTFASPDKTFIRAKNERDPGRFLSETPRMLIGVNSATRFEQTERGQELSGPSFVASLKTKTFESFLKQWLGENPSAIVCGMNGNEAESSCGPSPK